MLKKNTQVALLAAATLPLLGFQAQALEFNVTAGANIWDVSPSGEIQGNKNDPKLDLKDQLGLSDDTFTSIFVQFDHPIPVIPNFRVTQTGLDLSGSKNTTFDFKGETFTGNVKSTIDLSHTDVTAYYRLLDGITSFIPLVDLRLELGLTLRLIDGEFAVTGDVGGTSQTETVDFSAPLPMGYVGGRVGLPFGLSVGASLNTISYDGNGITDLMADVRYQYDGLPLIKPGITAGYRDLSVKLDDLDDAYGDLTLSGPFFGAYIRAGF